MTRKTIARRRHPKKSQPTAIPEISQLTEVPAPQGVGTFFDTDEEFVKALHMLKPGHSLNVQHLAAQQRLRNRKK